MVKTLLTRETLRKALSATLAVALVTSLFAVNALMPVDAAGGYAGAQAEEVITDAATPLASGIEAEKPAYFSDHTWKMVNTYLVQASDGTYSLNRSALKTQEDWKNLGAIGFFLWEYEKADNVYAGHEAWKFASEVYLRPIENYLGPAFKNIANDTKAIEICTKKFNTYMPNSDLGKEYDGTAFIHIQRGIDLCSGFNACREMENQFNSQESNGKMKLEPCSISPIVTANAVISGNIMSIIRTHAYLSFYNEIGSFSASKNNPSRDSLADITVEYNPYRQWYFLEREISKNPNRVISGADNNYDPFILGSDHYSFIVQNDLKAIGAAVNWNTKGFSTASGTHDVSGTQRPKSYDLLLTTDEYQACFNDYKAYLATLPSDPSRDMTQETGEETANPGYGTSTTKKASATIAAKDGSTLKDPYTMGGAATYYPYVTTTDNLVITVTCDGKVLTENTDYKVTFANADKASFTSENIKAATATVTCLTTDAWPAITLEFAIKPASSSTTNPGTETTPATPGDTTDRYEVFGTTLWLNDYTKVTAQGVYTTTDGNRVYVGANGKVTTPTTPVTVGGVTYRPYTNPDGTTTLLTETEYAKTPEGAAEAKAAEEAAKPSTGNNDNPSTSSEETKPSTPGTTTTTTPTTPQVPSTETKPSSGNTTSTPSAPSKPQANASSTSTSKPSAGSASTPSTVTPKPNVTTTTGQATPKPYVKTAKDKAALNKAKKALKKVKPTLKAVKAKGKKKATITIKPLTKAQRKQATGLQVQYAANKKFTKAAKTKTVKATAKTVKLTKLASKKTVYVRVRAYKDVTLGNGSAERVYGPWGKVKSVKVK